MSDQLTLRVPVPADLQALGRVAYATGFFGKSAARYLPDERLFTLLWIWPYLHGGGGHASLIALSSQGPLGYILGASNPNTYATAFVAALALAGLATLGGEVKQPLQSWRYPIRSLRFPTPHANPQLYPAHLHINLLSTARGLGLGSHLLEQHLEKLRREGVAGVQLSTTKENGAALGLYRKFGFKVLLQQRSPLWIPWLGHPATHVVMGLRLR